MGDDATTFIECGRSRHDRIVIVDPFR